ncbi:MAG: adenylyl-sulfate kinase [Candidatus Undinarchaeales archaeon]
MTFCIWITGLPGSGKSTIAKKVKELYSKEVEILRLDEIRDEIRKEIKNLPEKYTKKERELVYSKLAEKAEKEYEKGKNIIIDATAHKRKWRESARKKIGNFKVVYIKCPLETAMKRESKRKDNLVVQDLYEKALSEDKTVKGLPGVDVEYEEPINPELIIKSDKISPEKAAKRIIEMIK